MEILLTAIVVVTILVIAILVGTGGKPMRFFTAFGDAAGTLVANKVYLFWTAVCAGLVLLLIYYIYLAPMLNMGPAQPIAFSHRVHAGVKQIDCRFCHPYVGRSTFPGLPPVEKCLYCHNYIIANHPEIRKEHNYFDTDTPTPWVKANYLPEHVMFNHQRHIKKEIQCESCHGRVETQDRLRAHHFKMEFCIECHRHKDANLGCWLACHN